jgi:hypothetical protein
MIPRAAMKRAARLVRRSGSAVVVRAETASPRGRWIPYDHSDPTGGCPCDGCVWARAHPMEEVTPRRPGQLTAYQLEQERIHETHLAAELAMWHALVWLPELRAERMVCLSLVLRQLRAELHAAWLRRFLPSLAGRHHAPPLALCLDHVTAAPRTGPPAGTAAVGIALPDCTGGAVIVP